ncbi:MAG TPA: DNA polymerase Y family protein [Acidimicrobiia bacterium]
MTTSRSSKPADGMAERTACLWCPEWPVVALRARDPALCDVAVAVVERGERGLVVIAASTEAIAEGVTPGLRRREAEARCPGLVVVEADPQVEARAFERIARAVETFTPRFVLEEPGRLTFPTRGPSRYFGGDNAMAVRCLDTVRDIGITDARVGVADGGFAAVLAARAADSGAVYVVPPGESSGFLAPWLVGVLEDSEPGEAAGVADLLVRLGVRTLGAFAALPDGAVLGRFGSAGARAHRLARGDDELTMSPAPPPPELIETAELDPPAVHVETAAFAAKGLAERLMARLGALGLACTRVTIEAETERGERLTRCWRHEGALTPAALAARVRWQLEGWLTAEMRDDGNDDSSVDELATSALVLLRLVPDEVLPATGRQLGFWGGDPAAADRAGRVLARVQGMLGHPAVVTAVPQGGRTPGERVRWVPWGDPREPARLRDAVTAPGANVREIPPWPGAIPAPAPARVFEPPPPAELLDAAGEVVTVSGRGDPSAPPARLRCAALPGRGGEIAAWAGPWAHDARWWDRRARARRAYWQVLVAAPDGENIACLVAVTAGHAALEAIYD